MTESGGQIERWGIFEIALVDPAVESASGNPFFDVPFSVVFTHRHRSVEVDGFYDGGGVFRARFMPDTVGEWSFVTRSVRETLSGKAGGFTCVEPAASNHGPVEVRDRFHFAYADGSPYRQIGTTCYAWTHQGDALEETTLKTLESAPFNKLRMCVFPKHYRYNANEPERYPFERGTEGTGQPDFRWDFSRPNPAFFRHFEGRVGDLMRLGIEADIIIFHPYDRWGFSNMGAANNDRYLRYLVARFSAFRNVWWSLANEYDLMKAKSLADWERFFKIIWEADPYGHLRSIHNCHVFYDHARPWVTHSSIQRSDVERTAEWRETYGKPVVIDECCYEGNIAQRWGDITAEEMVRRFWEGVARGGYVGHGETFLDPDDLLWWAKGGVLRGESPTRLVFLRDILAQAPESGLDPQKGIVRHDHPCAGKAGEYYLVYTGPHRPARLELSLPEGQRYRAEVVDTWAMTRTDLPDEYSGDCIAELPGKPYTVLVFRRVG